MSADPVHTPTILLLEKITRSAVVRFAARLEALGIRPKHAALLIAPVRLEPPPQADVGVWLGVGPSAVVGPIDDLEQRGAVVRVSDPTNRRRWAISLTAAREELAAAAQHLGEETDDEIFGVLAARQTQALHDAALAVAAGLGLAGR